VSAEADIFGYVDRVRTCGCIVGVIADEPDYADSVADFLAESARAGRYCERHAVTAIRQMPLMQYCAACRAG
jgi:hypothetical protein